MSLTEIAQAFGEWPVTTQALVVGAVVLTPVQIAMRVRHRRAHWREVMREHDRRTGPSRIVQIAKAGRGSTIIQSAGDNSVQIINTGGGTFNVQSGRAGSGVIVTGLGAAKAQAALQGASHKALRKLQAEANDATTTRVVMTSTGPKTLTFDANGDVISGPVKAPPDRSKERLRSEAERRWSVDPLGRAEPQSLTEWRAPTNGLLATTWCAGCDDLVQVTAMGWTMDGRYRCKTCRGVDAVAECQADDEPSRHADAGSIDGLQNLQDLVFQIAQHAEADDASMASMIPLIVQTPWTPSSAAMHVDPDGPLAAMTASTPTVDPWLHRDTTGTPLSQTDPPCACDDCRSGKRQDAQRVFDGTTGRQTHLLSPAGQPITYDPAAPAGQRFATTVSSDVEPGSLVDQVLHTIVNIGDCPHGWRPDICWRCVPDTPEPWQPRFGMEKGY